MTRFWKVTAVSAALAVGLSAIAVAQLGSLLKGGAIAVAVDKFGPDIDKFINNVTGDKNVGTNQATKVVPIVSLGGGAYAGAVQVAGPRAQVEKVRAVAQLEQSFKMIGGVRIKALIPISTKNPGSSISRVPGVGVSAIVDFRL
jgi:hypothetical protein